MRTDEAQSLRSIKLENFRLLLRPELEEGAGFEFPSIAGFASARLA
jgi:hypothetical protein